MHPVNVYYEMDCSVLYQVMEKGALSGLEWQFIELATDLLSLNESLSEVSFYVVDCQGNKGADFLSVNGCKEMFHNALVVEPASSMLAILDKDSLGQQIGNQVGVGFDNFGKNGIG